MIFIPNTSESAYQHLRPAFQSWDKNVGSIDQTPSPPKYKEGVWGRDYLAVHSLFIVVLFFFSFSLMPPICLSRRGHSARNSRDGSQRPPTVSTRSTRTGLNTNVSTCSSLSSDSRLASYSATLNMICSRDKQGRIAVIPVVPLLM